MEKKEKTIEEIKQEIISIFKKKSDEFRFKSYEATSKYVAKELKAKGDALREAGKLAAETVIEKNDDVTTFLHRFQDKLMSYCDWFWGSSLSSSYTMHGKFEVSWTLNKFAESLNLKEYNKDWRIY